MTPEVVLLLLRLLSAALLLGFLLLIAWFSYRDLQALTNEVADRQRQHGVLRVVSSEEELAAGDGHYPLLPLTTIGRALVNTVVLEDNYASNEHALIMLRGRQWWLEDRGSRNGTLLNGVLLDSPAVISAGDVVTVGNTRLKVELE